MLKKYFVKFIPSLVFLLFIFLISYKVVPLHGEIVGWGDYPYFFPESNFRPFSTWGVNMLGESFLVNMFGIVFTGYLPTMFSFFGFNHSFISFFLNYMPVFLVCITTFYVIRKISKNNLIAYFSGFFIILNNFILEQFLLWPGHFFYNIIGLIILFYLTYQIYLFGFDKNKVIYLILNSLLILHPYFLVIYILYLFFFFVFYWSVYHNIFFKIQDCFLIFFGIISIHTYWILPFLSNFFYQESSFSYNGNLLNVLNGYIDTTSYTNLFNYFNYAGMLSLKLGHGTIQYIFYYVLLLVLTLILFKIRRWQIDNKRYIIFLIGIFLVFFTLALGPISRLTGIAWMWAFIHIPGFVFFRSFTRFLIVPLVATIFLFAVFVKKWNIREIYKNIIISIGIISLVFVNQIFFTGNLKGTISLEKVPKQYFEINKKYFESDNSFNIISYPNVSYESYIWAINNNRNLFAQVTYFNIYFFHKPIINNSFVYFLDLKNTLFEKAFALNYNFNFYKDFDRDLSNLNIKYVLVRKDLVDIVHNMEQVEYEEYYNYFNKSPQYVLRENNEYFSLFEKKIIEPLIVGRNVFFQNINNTNYKIIMKGIKSQEPIYFLQNFHLGWELYLQPIYPVDECGVIGIYKSEMLKDADVTECEVTSDFFSDVGFNNLFRNPIFYNNHRIENEYANAWTINPEYIKTHYPKMYYRENLDGSIDIKMTLYFKPQNYFFLGLIISGITILLLLSNIMYSLHKRLR